MRFATCTVSEHQLWLYGHVAPFPDADPAQQVLSAREPHEWRRPMGQSHASWLQLVDQNLKEMGIGPGICLVDGQTKSLGLPAVGECSDVR